MKIYDLVIVGGGPAGSFLGMLLAKAGVSVVIIDAHVKKKRKICGEYLCPKGVEILWQAGCGMIAGNRLIQGMKLVAPNGSAVPSFFPANVTQGGRAIRRDVFDQQLLNQALAAGCDLRLGELADFQSDGMVWRFHSQGEYFGGRFLVGADGRQSMVAKKMGVENSKSPKRVALHQYVPAAGSQMGEMHILPDGSYVGINPTGDNELNLSLVCDSEQLKGKSPRATWESLLRQSPELHSRFSAFYDQEIFVTSPISHEVDSVVGNRWALIGDAAGFLDPLTGEGMYQALLSASLFSESYLAMREKTLFPDLITEYSRQRRKIFFQKRLVNILFQKMIRRPWLCNLFANFLLLDARIANTFIGMVGNIFSPSQAMKQLLLERK